jgi:hypothetical protein
MRRKVQAPTFSGEEPPAELLRYSLDATGDYSGLEDWLRARRRWRQTHERPLLGLYARDRHALHRRTDLDPELVSGEMAAPKADPEWVQGAQANRSRSGRGTGSIPEVAHRVDSPGDPRQGVAE